MAKRKAVEVDDAPTTATRRSSRRKTTASPTKTESKAKPAAKPAKPVKASKTKQSPKEVALEDMSPVSKPNKQAKIVGAKEASSVDQNGASKRQYWLMKAEPESRIEKGKDIKFSIDDLAAKKEPEPWDGIRNFVARNNMRAMKKGDLAFFYHSSCKVPAIVGTMEIVQEHTPDLSAQDPKEPYYDPKDTDPEKPKWSVVHVEFRNKFKVPIELTELRKLAAKNDGLEGLQMLKQTRLSVSKVEEGEWEYLMKWERDADKEEE